MIRLIKSFLLSALFVITLNAQQYHMIMSYNLLNYPGSDTTTRNPYYRTVFESIQPDILVVQEMQSQAGVNGFLNNVLNVSAGGYSAGIFIDGPDTDRAIFYKSNYFTFISNTPISTTLRDINEFKMVHNITQDTIRIYVVHLKASTGSTNEQRRLEEITELRNHTDSLHAGAFFIVAGDFNIYRSSEPAFQKLLDQSSSGYFIDPLNLSGTFNQSLFAQYHTQSPRTRSFGGGATGGMDDRFDMILISQTVSDVNNITYINGSTIAYGNDGNHYNDSINKPPNTAVGQQIADALHYASDHLPVFAIFSFGEVIPVQIDVFTATVLVNSVHLKWQTITETNNKGFEIERRTGSWNTYYGSWETIGFVPGSGTSTQINSYEFNDQNLLPGSYEYRFKQIDGDGSFEYGPSIAVDISAPGDFVLEQNYPNPFNPTTTISWQSPIDSRQIIRVFNLLGMEVATLIDEVKSSGYHEISFNASALPSGVYFYQLQAGTIVQTKKMTLLR